MLRTYTRETLDTLGKPRHGATGIILKLDTLALRTFIGIFASYFLALALALLRPSEPLLGFRRKTLKNAKPTTSANTKLDTTAYANTKTTTNAFITHQNLYHNQH